MTTLDDAMRFLGLTKEPARRPEPYEFVITRSRAERRELGEEIRRLPDRYAGRLPAETVKSIGDAATAGEWEEAIRRLVSALYGQGHAISAAERHDLAAVVRALNLPAELLDRLEHR